MMLLWLFFLLIRVSFKENLIDNGYGLTFCSMEMDIVINADLTTILLDNVPTPGCDNIMKRTMGIITLLIKVGLVILNTPIHVIP